jgi:hypothetical protein
MNLKHFENYINEKMQDFYIAHTYQRQRKC